MSNLIDLTGERFGKLLVLNRADDYVSPQGKKFTSWNCLCDCGKNTVVTSQCLRSRKTTSCGCYLNAVRGKSSIKSNLYCIQDDILIVETSNGAKFKIDTEDIWVLEKYCWSISKQGYVIAKERNGKQSKTILLHRLILSCEDKNMVVDHINHNTLDNRRCNLRVCNQSQNMMNAITPKDNSSGVKGVAWDKDREKWIASIGVNGKNIFLGRYDTKCNAVSARKLGEQKYFKSFNYNDYPVSCVLAIDTGTTQSGFCIIDSTNCSLIKFGKVSNEEILEIISSVNPLYTTVVFEKFAPQSTIGKTTIDSIVWYGKFIRECEILELEYKELYRREVKKHFLGKVDKSKGSADSQMRKALIGRFAKHDFKNGKGTKNNPDYFFGVSTTDVYAAFAVGIMWLDISKSNTSIDNRNA